MSWLAEVEYIEAEQGERVAWCQLIEDAVFGMNEQLELYLSMFNTEHLRGGGREPRLSE